MLKRKYMSTILPPLFFKRAVNHYTPLIYNKLDAKSNYL